MRARLIPLDGGPAVELAKDMTLVGRTDDCDLRVDHKSVSKLHCVLVRSDGVVLVRDLGSTNGTRVNGQRVRRAALLPGDEFGIAHYRYKLVIGDDPADRPADVRPVAPSDPLPDADTPPPAPRPAGRPPDPDLRRNALPDVYPDGPKPG